MSDYLLSLEHKKILDNLKSMMQDDIVVRERIYNWTKEKIGKDLTDHFDELSDDTKLGACLDHIAIALVSGDITSDEIKHLRDTT